jgi:hypothetical protein
MWECAFSVLCILGSLGLAAWLRDHGHAGCCEHDAADGRKSSD